MSALFFVGGFVGGFGFFTGYVTTGGAGGFLERVGAGTGGGGRRGGELRRYF